MPSLEELPLTLYLGGVVFLTVLVMPSLKPLSQYRMVLLLLTTVSLLATWSQMFLYLDRSYRSSAARAGVALDSWSSKQWLGSTQLFEEAWGYVCATPERWWWSSQICFLTVGVWTPFTWSQGRRSKMASLALFMLLGQTVAISFASGLFLLSLPAPTAPKPSSKPTRPLHDGVCPTSLLLAVGFGLAMTHAVPSVTSTPRFLPVLLLMHAALFLPLLPIGLASPPVGPSSLLRPRLSHLYAFSALVSAVHYVFLTFSGLPTLPDNTTLPNYLLHVLAHHPAQASVSLDVVFTALIHFFWTFTDWRSLLALSSHLERLRKGDASNKDTATSKQPNFVGVAATIWIVMPLIGPAATFAGYLAWAEQTRNHLERTFRRLEQKKD